MTLANRTRALANEHRARDPSLAALLSGIAMDVGRLEAERPDPAGDVAERVARQDQFGRVR
jgi:hypothetical protein